MPTGGEREPLDVRSGLDWRWVAGPMLLATAAGLAPTLAIASIEQLRFVYEGAQLRSALDTAQCLIGALVAYLLYGRFRRTGLLNDLALSYSLGLSAATSLFFATVPAVVDDLQPSAFTTWAPLTARVLSGVVVVWAALAPDHPFRLRTRPGPTLMTALGTTVAVIALAFWVLGDRLPDGVERSLAASESGRPRLEGEPVLLLAQLLLMGCFLAAAVGFARRSLVDRSTLTRSLAAACVLNAFARFNFFLYPSLYTDIVHIGDLLRLGYFLVLLGGATGEINQYWLAQTQAAMAAERRRMARDLHDGLTQELAFIHSQTTSLSAGRSDERMLGHVAAAADRALRQSRRVVDALALPPDLSLRAVLDAAIEGLPDAYGATVELSVDDLSVGIETRDALAWIVREAVGNALRHGGATRVTVAVQATGDVVALLVHDDGSGFPAGVAVPRDRSGGFGLRSIRERAEILGGHVEVTSEPGTGTSVRAWLPARG